MCIEVYDLGLSPRELQLLGKFARVHVRQLRWDALPSHLRDINMFAWKPLAMYDSIRRLRSFQMINWESDGLPRKYGMFYTDPSIEYRQSIVEIKQRIFSTGYFYIHQEGLQTNYECCGPIGTCNACDGVKNESNNGR